MPPPASRVRRSLRLRDTLAAAPGLLTHGSVTETVKLCPMGPKLRYTTVRKGQTQALGQTVSVVPCQLCAVVLRALW